MYFFKTIKGAQKVRSKDLVYEKPFQLSSRTPHAYKNNTIRYTYFYNHLNF